MSERLQQVVNVFFFFLKGAGRRWDLFFFFRNRLVAVGTGIVSLLTCGRKFHITATRVTVVQEVH